MADYKQLRDALEQAANELDFAENALSCSSYHNAAQRAKQAAHAARAVLAKAEPEVPSAQKIEQLWKACNNPGVFARAALARWGRPAPATAGEVGELADFLRACADDYESHGRCRLIRAADLLERQAAPQPVAIPGEEYHEDMGPVTWWRLPVEEPPWVGTPNDSDWPGYHTHFTPAPPEPCNALPTPSEND